jgi:acyl-coenzyme A thioesterase PaaI-like protein
LVHRGGKVATAEGKLLDSKGNVLAHGTTTCLLIPRPSTSRP